jgi:hypothetical protein
MILNQWFIITNPPSWVIISPRIIFGGKKCELVQQQQFTPKTTVPMPQSTENGIKFA